MLKRLLGLGVRRFVGGPGNSWVFTSAAFAFYNLMRRQFGRRELLDLSNTKPGDMIVIEHLHETHKEQIKGERRAKRSEKKVKRQAKAQIKMIKKASRQESKAARSARRQERSSSRAAKRSKRASSRADRLQRRADKVRSRA